MSNEIANPLDHVTYSVYKCNDCTEKRCVVNIPAVIDGVLQDDIGIADSCSSCHSSDITTLFETKSKDEYEVYCKIIAMEYEVDDE